MMAFYAGAEEVLMRAISSLLCPQRPTQPEIRALDEAGLSTTTRPGLPPDHGVDLDAEGAKKFAKPADAKKSLDDVQNAERPTSLTRLAAVS